MQQGNSDVDFLFFWTYDTHSSANFCGHKLGTMNCNWNILLCGSRRAYILILPSTKSHAKKWLTMEPIEHIRRIRANKAMFLGIYLGTEVVFSHVPMLYPFLSLYIRHIILSTITYVAEVTCHERVCSVGGLKWKDSKTIPMASGDSRSSGWRLRGLKMCVYIGTFINPCPFSLGLHWFSGRFALKSSFRLWSSQRA